jgi:hypothetical protein
VPVDAGGRRLVSGRTWRFRVISGQDPNGCTPSQGGSGIVESPTPNRTNVLSFSVRR